MIECELRRAKLHVPLHRGHTGGLSPNAQPPQQPYFEDRG
jgi:hypothetical protein